MSKVIGKRRNNNRYRYAWDNIDAHQFISTHNTEENDKNSNIDLILKNPNYAILYNIAWRTHLHNSAAFFIYSLERYCAFIWYALPLILRNTTSYPKKHYLFLAAGSKYPLRGSEEIMKKKLHGTSDSPVQSNLKYGCDVALADRICNYNRRFAEHAGTLTNILFSFLFWCIVCLFFMDRGSILFCKYFHLNYKSIINTMLGWWVYLWEWFVYH